MKAGPNEQHSSRCLKTSYDGVRQVSCDTDYWLMVAGKVRSLENHEDRPFGGSVLAVLTPG